MNYDLTEVALCLNFGELANGDMSFGSKEDIMQLHTMWSTLRSIRSIYRHHGMRIGQQTTNREPGNLSLTHVDPLHCFISLLQDLFDTFSEILVLPLFILHRGSRVVSVIRTHVAQWLDRCRNTIHLIELGALRCLGDDAIDLRLVFGETLEGNVNYPKCELR